MHTPKPSRGLSPVCLNAGDIEADQGLPATRTSSRTRTKARWRSLWIGLVTITLGMGWIESPRDAIALTTETIFLLTEPLDEELLETNELPADNSVITPNTISQTSLTIPSLWWVDEQFGGKLLNTWLAYPGTDNTPARVDLVVNNPVWNAANYLQRYTFLNHFGREAADFGYSVRVFNGQQDLLGAYICTELTEPGEQQGGVRCNVFLESSGQGALAGGSTNPFAAP